MSRLPPSHIGPKHFGGRPTNKGPASTKTLTTNTLTNTTVATSVIHDPSVPRTYLFDIYKNEAESHFEIGEYRQAADCYNAAIKLQPEDTAAIVARSRCYVQMGRWKRAMKDCDEALSLDPSFPEALYLKAEILYLNGNFDLAHVYFKRGLRQQPDSILFKQAVQKASEAMHKCGGGGGGKPNKLTAVGDLSMFLHHKQKKTPRDKETPRTEDEGEKHIELPSAGFRARFNVGPLIRINKKPGVSILRSYRPESARSASSAGSATRTPDERTMRTILGELYGDRKYLKKFQNSLPGGKAERDLTLLADEGLDFLRERTMFWDSLGPLPPPQVPRRSNMRERSTFFFGSTDSLNALDTNRTPRGAGTTTDHDTTKPEEGRRRMPRRPKRKKIEVALGLERDCTTIDFKFSSLKESRSASRIDNSPEMIPSLPILRDISRTKTKMGRATFVGIDNAARDRKRELTRFINKEMDNIDEAFKTGEFSDCKHKAEVCLKTVSELESEDINKSEVMASLHSCIGNASIAMNDFDTAYRHHMEALNIGETENLHEVINRSLGHLGRMYIIQKRFNKALEVFARKAPTVISAEEIAQVFHEIGNCFLALGHLDYARDCGKKALRAALDADIHYFKFQSWVLIAVSESRMKHHDEAYKAFQSALELAREKDDQESIQVIMFAMEHLSKTITSIMRKREILSERLTSRSKTQAVIDLNKRPHAARQKKRKKKLRREATTLDDGDDMTREHTMITREHTMITLKDDLGLRHTVDKDHEKHNLSPRAEDGGLAGVGHGKHVDFLSPRPDGRRGSIMFEESPRELEPFGDPSHRMHKRLSIHGVHKRHGGLEHLEGGTRGGAESGANSNLDYSRERTLSKLDHTPRTHSQLDTSRDLSRTQSKMDTPRDGGERHHAGSRAEGGQTSPRRVNLSPSKRHDVTGGRSEHSTPREGRDYVLMTDRTDMTSQSEHVDPHHHHGAAHHVRRAHRRDSRDSSTTDAVAHHHDQHPDEQVSPRRRKTKRSAVRDSSFQETPGNTTYEGDVTGVSSGPGHWSRADDLTPGRYADLSGTLESDAITPSAHYDLDRVEHTVGTPRTHRSPDKQDSPRRSPSKKISPTRLPSVHGKTPGRFTRESYFDEDEEMRGKSVDMTASFDLVSVSRQQHNQSRGLAHKPPETGAEIVPEPKQVDVGEKDTKNKSYEREDGKATPVPLERRSSKVSLRGVGHEEATVTLETTKPYRVSSATSARTPRSARKTADDTNEGSVTPRKGKDIEGTPDVTPTPRHTEDPDATPTPRSRQKIKLKLNLEAEEQQQHAEEVIPPQADGLLSPVKSQVSAVTTGSGWEGDVSVESETATRDEHSQKKSPRAKHTKKTHKKRGGEGEEKHLPVQEESRGGSTESMTKSQTGSKGADLDGTQADVTMTSELMKAEGANESTVTSLAADAVKEEVLRNTSQAPEREQEMISLAKEAHREHKHANKIRREARDLDDIQSVPYSSNADLQMVAPSTIKDADLSTSLPFTDGTGQLVSDDGQSRRSRPLAPAEERPESEDLPPSSVD